MKLTLPTDSTERKSYPMARGPLAYFPAALAGVAAVCEAGRKKHTPNDTLHHARGLSADHADCIVRHLMDVQDIDAYLQRGGDNCAIDALLTEANQLAWRALALSQELHEHYADAPLAPGARLPEAPVPAGTADDVPVLIDYAHEIPACPAATPCTDWTKCDPWDCPKAPLHVPAGADWRERGIARDEHGGTATAG